eukprot:1562209-Amphidinium_carterae.1
MKGWHINSRELSYKLRKNDLCTVVLFPLTIEHPLSALSSSVYCTSPTNTTQIKLFDCNAKANSAAVLKPKLGKPATRAG